MSEHLKILVVEDDEALRDALLITLEAAGHAASGADGGPQALQLLAQHSFNMVVSDLRMAPMDGLELLHEIRARWPGLPVLLMTAFGDVDKAVAAMRGGACDFMMKPFEPRALIEQIARYATAPLADDLIAEDPQTRAVLLLAARVAKSEATVLLTGESGVGKEVFARYIHDRSARSQGPFVAINCAAIPDSLLEATLFGHEKGAFTGAQSAQAGKFEQANGGTLLLDEISEMPLPLQAKLLRVLQEREVERVGGKKPVPLDIRVLATSNRDMAAEVKQGGFREDLYYRLNVFPLEIPALRDRPADIVPLARYFIGLHGAPSGRTASLAASAEAKLAGHDWPGNVRELENVIQRALILAPGNSIEAEHLLFGSAAGAGGMGTSAPAVAASAPVMPRPAAAPSSSATGAPAAAGSRATMQDLERQHILETLAAVGGSRKLAVERLGISERTLRYKLKQYREEGWLEDKPDNED
ncbi:Acetoacetate metabolism regulatory protein AtoC [Sterolibacterium denitrificans]|uniref:Acetoacetate metabolism regulatory protein AtoC n=1 Tax=Sterolibacterium denitrificans TaxID=157592 RepID=A0A7Z7HSL9_9PROT|nr:sigma-54 dependent transcriptional regulator [Sterolibacterium denitrificans]SMB30591.1 Acetoacetate metabolism regulatory protein AtoC [Sterolibacterium denitrificans]